ncbi:MAG: hypothetical protein ACI835_005733, partial [Planctomycetota bacterium]
MRCFLRLQYLRPSISIIPILCALQCCFSVSETTARSNPVQPFAALPCVPLQLTKLAMKSERHPRFEFHIGRLLGLCAVFMTLNLAAEPAH